jgi:hypothetical protein
MTPVDMIFLLRQYLSDEQAVGWPRDEELTSYLDRAADYLSERLIADKDPAMLARLHLDGATELPGDFVAFAGNVPASIMGGMCEPYFDFPYDASYWARMPHVSKLDRESETPYGPERELLITDIARLFALNRNEYDISQDLTVLGEAMGALKGARDSAKAGK